MTDQREVTRYAVPSLTRSRWNHKQWNVVAQPYGYLVGVAEEHDAGWTATTTRNQVLGLWPTKQAAAEVLVKQAGYELEMS